MSQEGKIKWYSLAKGYGFITPEDGSDDVFVHHSLLPDEKTRPPGEGERVRFEAEEGERGLRATRVERLDAG